MSRLVIDKIFCFCFFFLPSRLFMRYYSLFFFSFSHTLLERLRWVLYIMRLARYPYTYLLLNLEVGLPTTYINDLVDMFYMFDKHVCLEPNRWKSIPISMANCAPVSIMPRCASQSP